MKKSMLSAEVSSPSPPPSSLCMTLRATREPARVKSVTRDEIDRYWRMRRMIEDDHLIAAEKAAARIRAKALKNDEQEKEYRRLTDSLEEMPKSSANKDRKNGNIEADAGTDDSEIWMGIKNWWTRSKFAHLNQPAIESMGNTATAQCPTSGTCSCYLSPAVVLF